VSGSVDPFFFLRVVEGFLRAFLVGLERGGDSCGCRFWVWSVRVVVIELVFILLLEEEGFVSLVVLVVMN